MSNDDFPPTLRSRSTMSSTLSSRSSILELEQEFQTLRDQSLSYEDDVEFHRFIGVMDLVDTVIVERPARDLRRRSFARLLGGFRKHTEKPPLPESLTSPD
ncbi:hypothetical protein BGZ63DRAFT_426557 [Mariannaea sp. PMI_226]|nr:hypothetical protein BGZ63DRAFT_426557 [Mariannaea sp. PMI_226]